MMDFMGWVENVLPEYGPWFLMVLVYLETSFLTGLLFPSSVATALATAIAVDGGLPLSGVVGAALAGAWLGDSTGFFLGRRSGEAALQARGPFGRAMAARRRRLNRFMGRHPLVSVSAARLVSFVRTIMPLAAGMSDLSYRRFLVFQALGMTGWLALYVGIGLLAGESWQAVTRMLGVGGTLVFLAVAAGVAVVLRRAAPRVRSGGPEAPEARVETPMVDPPPPVPPVEER